MNRMDNPFSSFPRTRESRDTVELVVAEASSGDPETAGRSLNALKGIPELPIDEEVEYAANKLIGANAADV